MQTRQTLAPGQKGAKNFPERYYAAFEINAHHYLIVVDSLTGRKRGDMRYEEDKNI